MKAGARATAREGVVFQSAAMMGIEGDWWGGGGRKKKEEVRGRARARRREKGRERRGWEEGQRFLHFVGEESWKKKCRKK